MESQNDLQGIRGIQYIQKGRLDMSYLWKWSDEMPEHPAIRELDEFLSTSATDGPTNPPH